LFTVRVSLGGKKKKKERELAELPFVPWRAFDHTNHHTLKDQERLLSLADHLTNILAFHPLSMDRLLSS
jgi:hypothetical protein